MEDNSSKRIVEQRLRNQIMEVIEMLADGDDGVRRVGSHEYFNLFYDVVPYRNDGEFRHYSFVSTTERDLILEVGKILDDACDATSSVVDDNELIGTGWPKRIQPVARRALDLMLISGRFIE